MAVAAAPPCRSTVAASAGAKANGALIEMDDIQLFNEKPLHRETFFLPSSSSVLWGSSSLQNIEEVNNTNVGTRYSQLMQCISIVHISYRDKALNDFDIIFTHRSL